MHKNDGPDTPPEEPMTRRLTVLAAGLGAAFFLVAGAWSFLWPRSFFETVALYPPYNEHLFHDLGAFQLGIGAALAAGLAPVRGLVAGLVGGAAGATFHTASHWIDRGHGGRESDPLITSLLAVVLVLAAIVTARRRA